MRNAKIGLSILPPPTFTCKDAGLFSHSMLQKYCSPAVLGSMLPREARGALHRIVIPQLPQRPKPATVIAMSDASGLGSGLATS